MKKMWPADLRCSMSPFAPKGNKSSFFIIWDMDTPPWLQAHSDGAPPPQWCHGELIGFQRGDMPLATEELAALIGFSNSFNRTMTTPILLFRIRPWCARSLCGRALEILAISFPFLQTSRDSTCRSQIALCIWKGAQMQTPPVQGLCTKWRVWFWAIFSHF